MSTESSPPESSNQAESSPKAVPPSDPATAPGTGAAAPSAAAATDPTSKLILRVVAVMALAAMVGSLLLWQKLSGIQQQLARQSADAGAMANEARATAKQAQDLALETAAKQAVMEARVAEVSLQRSQLEELMQSLSRSRDENLVVDIESAIRLAQQQSQLTGSIQPLLAALNSAEARVSRAAQPRLTVLQRAIARDIARIKSSTLSDTSSLLVRMDELVVLADEMPLANGVGRARAAAPRSTDAKASDESGKPAPAVAWWSAWGKIVLDEFRSLVRVSRIEHPDAALLTPEQSFFLRENLKLRLLNARLGLLSRQVESARADLGLAGASIARYFDTSSRKTQLAQGLLQQVQGQMRSLEIPRIDDTLAALATAAAGR